MRVAARPVKPRQFLQVLEALLAASERTTEQRTILDVGYLEAAELRLRQFGENFGFSLQDWTTYRAFP